MAWRRPGDKPLSEPMMVGLPTHICVARPQWVNCLSNCRVPNCIPSYSFHPVSCSLHIVLFLLYMLLTWTLKNISLHVSPLPKLWYCSIIVINGISCTSMIDTFACLTFAMNTFSLLLSLFMISQFGGFVVSCARMFVIFITLFIHTSSTLPHLLSIRATISRKMFINNKFEAQTLTGNPTGNSRCHLLNMSRSFGQSARSLENRCVVMD